MKKLFTLFMSSLMLLVLSCSKHAPVEKETERNQEEEGIEEEPGYVAPIVIDGDFSDWSSLDKTKVSEAVCASYTIHTALKVLRVYMDEMFMYVYFEFDPEELPDRSVVHTHVYFDSDNDATTGGCSNQWNPGCIEYMGEGDIISNNEFVSYNPSLSAWIGKPLAEGWDWEPVMSSGSGLFTGVGNGNAYEMALMREMFAQLGDEFGFGIDVQQGWSSVGVLPNAEISDDNPNGKSPLLKVKIAE